MPSGEMTRAWMASLIVVGFSAHVAMGGRISVVSVGVGVCSCHILVRMCVCMCVCFDSMSIFLFSLYFACI